MNDVTSQRPSGLSEQVLVVSGLTYSYGGRRILDGADLTVHSGESVAIMGSSGSGKSTLISCVLGLLSPAEGTIEVVGQRVRRGVSARSARLRREAIGVVFQAGHLLPELTPVENVAIAGMLAGMSGVKATLRAESLLDHLQVPSGSRSVTEFSGGEQQRVAVARALMNSPRLLLADEPTGSLDPENRDNVLDVLSTLPKEFGCAVVVVTHDPVAAARMDHVVRLVEGRFVVSELAVGA
jgi:putative ABC transport system ATP-binding protein/lipoprotein-releasing system ATP-binding protein